MEKEDNERDTLEKELIEMDSRYDPQTGRCREEPLDDIGALANTAFLSGSPILTWLLWQMREERRFGPVRKEKNNEHRE